MLKYKYATKEEMIAAVPAEHHDMYTEVDGAWVMTKIEGSEYRTQGDVEAVKSALEKERNDHKETKGKLSAFRDLDPAETLAKLDRIAELEVAAGGTLDDTAIDKIVENRIVTRLNPINRELDDLKTLNGKLASEVEGYKQKEIKAQIVADVIAKAKEAKVVDGALADIELLAPMMFEVDGFGKVVTRDTSGIAAGMDASVWLTEQQKIRTHWWPATHGAGGQGGGAGGYANPFDPKTLSLTEQGRLFRENPTLARQMAAQFGIKL